MSRLKLFWAWYVHLRTFSNGCVFPWYDPTSYSIHNCIGWAWFNSGIKAEIKKD